MAQSNANQGNSKRDKIVSYDVDTAHLILANSNGLKNKGRIDIIINCSEEEFNLNPEQVILDNLDYIITKHNLNCKDYNYLDKYFRGEQDIFCKHRPNGDDKINNIHVTNYAWQFVSFKKGYYVGKPIKYVDLNTETDDDIKYFNIYNRYVNKASKDLVKYENMLISGVAYSMIIPSRNDYDTEKTSPYEYYVLDNRDVCVVKSNDSIHTPLFAVCFSRKNPNSYVNSYSSYTIYYGNYCMKLDSSKIKLGESEYVCCGNPITEFQLNPQRMGVFEPVINALNSLNNIRSNQLDFLEEIINTYLTFENVDTKEILKHIDEFRAKRILAVSTVDPNTPAKIGSVKLDGDTSTTNNTYDSIEQRQYDIVGVPMAVSSTGQGVSGEAQVYGGGWESAQTIANVDTIYVTEYERQELVKFLTISGEALNSKTKNLNPYNIDIKYTINKSNNMLVKSQTFKYLRDLHVPFEQAFEMSEITDDPYTMAKVSEENRLRELSEEIELEVEKEKQLNSLTSSTDSDTKDDE